MFNFERASRLAMMQNARARSEGVVGRKLLKKCCLGVVVVVVVVVVLVAVVGVDVVSSCLAIKLLLLLWPSSGIRLRDTKVSVLLDGAESDIQLKRIQSMSLSSGSSK